MKIESPTGYKEFSNAEEAEVWVNAHYSEWLEEVHKEKRNPESGLPYILNMYTGSNYKIYNRIMRYPKSYTDEYYNEEKNEIELMKIGLAQCYAPENIVVYRFTSKKLFGLFFENRKIKVGNIFTDTAFLSTTLVKELLLQFALNNSCNRLLKLYIPKGTNGVYIDYKGSSYLDEREFLLAPNLKFRLIGRKITFVKPFPFITYELVTTDKER